MSYVYINHGGRPDVKIGSHEGEAPLQRLHSYRAERGVEHEEQFLIPVPAGSAQSVERLAHRMLASKRVSNNTELFFTSLEEAKLTVLNALHQSSVSQHDHKMSRSGSKIPPPKAPGRTKPIKDMLSFDVTHGQSVEERRNPATLEHAASQEVARPSKGGRKLEAIFEARNPNGLVAKYQEKFGDAVVEDSEVSRAIDYILRYGGPNCIGSWPHRPTLDAAFKTLEGSLLQKR